MEIKNKKGIENLVADHLSSLEGPNKVVQINDDFPNEQLLAIKDVKLVPCVRPILYILKCCSSCMEHCHWRLV